MRERAYTGAGLTIRVVFIAFFVISGVFALESDDKSGYIDVSYYKGQYVSDTIPSLLEAGKTYPVTITYRNNGMVSWTWDVEKFGMLYTGQQSSITVSPEFFPIRPDQKIRTGEEFTYSFTLVPPEKTGDYEISFSMATKKGENYTTFTDSFKKRVNVVSESGISSGSVGSIIVESEPSGAEVMLGRSHSGITPLTIPDLVPASYEVSVLHPDYKTKVVLVKVEPGSVSRFRVDLTNPGMPEVVTVKDERFTPLGFLKEKLPLIVLSVVILFVGLQLMMLDTKRFPENHPVRRMVRPVTLFPVSFGDAHTGDSGSRQGKGGSGEGSDASAGRHSDRKSSASSQAGGETRESARKAVDRKAEYSGEKRPGTGSGEGDTEVIAVPDVDQEYRGIDNPFGFPDGLKDRYEPLGVTGDDAYARVFKVRKKETGTVRALKVSHVKNVGSEILQKEASVWGNLKHPNIVRLYKAEFDDDLTFLDLEYLDGVGFKGEQITSLAALPKPIKEKFAVSLVRDIASGLKYTHYLGIRHYHLQAGDILLTPKMRAKISGYARGKNELGFSIPESDIKEASAPYITPEQKDAERYGNPGRKTDIYQLGVIFYELLTGYLPYSGEAIAATGGDRSETPEDNRLVLPSEIRQNLASYDTILRHMLSLEKKGRYSSVDEFIADLDAVPGQNKE